MVKLRIVSTSPTMKNNENPRKAEENRKDKATVPIEALMLCLKLPLVFAGRAGGVGVSVEMLNTNENSRMCRQEKTIHWP
jgi:hypothetical protein